jgi:hypothetical protein
MMPRGLGKDVGGAYHVLIFEVHWGYCITVLKKQECKTEKGVTWAFLDFLIPLSVSFSKP